MTYDKTVDLDNVTLQDCEDLYYEDLYKCKNVITIINDGKVIDFE